MAFSKVHQVSVCFIFGFFEEVRVCKGAGLAALESVSFRSLAIVFSIWILVELVGFGFEWVSQYLPTGTIILSILSFRIYRSITAFVTAAAVAAA